MGFPKTKIKFSCPIAGDTFKKVVIYIFEKGYKTQDELIHYATVCHFLEKKLSKERKVIKDVDINLSQAISLEYYFTEFIFSETFNEYTNLLLSRILVALSTFIDHKSERYEKEQSTKNIIIDEGTVSKKALQSVSV